MSEPKRTGVPERWTVAEGAEDDAKGAPSPPPAEGSDDDAPAAPAGRSDDAAREDGGGGGPGGAPRERRRRIDRSRARAWTLQILYRWESGGMRGSLPEALEETRRNRRIAPSRIPQIERLLELLDDRLPEVDRAIDGALDNWRLERLSTIDRAVLRIGAAELLFLDDIPPRASIQEAVRLADQYGGDESARFVNGVLDALYHR